MPKVTMLTISKGNMVMMNYSITMVAMVMILMTMMTSRGVEGVAGPGCTMSDLRRVKAELSPCLPQFYVPVQYASEGSCCGNASSQCCHGLRAALPIGDACMCTFLLHALRRSRDRGLPFSIDVPSALLHLSSQCSVDFGYGTPPRPASTVNNNVGSSHQKKCGKFLIP